MDDRRGDHLSGGDDRRGETARLSNGTDRLSRGNDQRGETARLSNGTDRLSRGDDRRGETAHLSNETDRLSRGDDRRGETTRLSNGTDHLSNESDRSFNEADRLSNGSDRLSERDELAAIFAPVMMTAAVVQEDGDLLGRSSQRYVKFVCVCLYDKHTKSVYYLSLLESVDVGGFIYDFYFLT